MPPKPVPLTQIEMNCVSKATLVHFSETMYCETVVLNYTLLDFCSKSYFGGHFELQTHECHYVHDYVFQL